MSADPSSPTGRPDDPPMCPVGLDVTYDVQNVPPPPPVGATRFRLGDDFTYHQRRFFEAVREFVPGVLTTLRDDVFPGYSQYRRTNPTSGPHLAEARDQGKVIRITASRTGGRRVR